MAAWWIVPVADPTEYVVFESGWHLPWPIWLMGVTGLAAASITPRWPWAGVLLLLLLDHGAQRYSPTYQFVLQTHLIELAAGLCLAGVALRARGTSMQEGAPGAFDAMLCVFLAWIALCWVIAANTMDVWQPSRTQHPTRWVVAAAMYFLARATRPGAQDLRLFAIVLASVLSARALTNWAGVRLDGDVSAMAAIALPVCAWSGWSGRPGPRLAGLLSTVVCFAIVVQSWNRGAAVAVLASALVLVLTLRVTGMRVLAGAIIVSAALSSVDTGYVDRFRELWRYGVHTGSAGERLAIWSSAGDLLRAHPLTGVGPGNFVAARRLAIPGAGRLGPHNSYVAVAAETGIPGLLLFLSFFGMVLWRGFVVAFASRRSALEANLPLPVVASLVAYLTVSGFIARPSLGLAYALAGVVASHSAVARRVDERGDV